MVGRRGRDDETKCHSGCRGRTTVDLAEAKATAMRQRGRIEARATIAKRQKKLMSRCKAAVNQSNGLTDIDRERSALVEEKHLGKATPAVCRRRHYDECIRNLQTHTTVTDETQRIRRTADGRNDFWNTACRRRKSGILSETCVCRQSW